MVAAVYLVMCLLALVQCSCLNTVPCGAERRVVGVLHPISSVYMLSLIRPNILEHLYSMGEFGMDLVLAMALLV